ncbi:MAG TPA: PP2C family protein-serine/threonine phosphatase, partial [Spirochaetia bacterium]|nr:PP2C family protein-serine/threonine phosphatase [Spirochaetia bacterium]
LILLVVCFLAARRVFNLQEGVIRKREYPFYAQILVTFIFMIVIIATPAPTKAENAPFLPLAWFSILNLAYIVRLIEEFFFWSQYNLRSDRNKMEQRQHTQNLLIRRVIGAEDQEDRAIVRELMDSALEKAQGRMVVSEYRMTGMAVYRATGNILKVEDLNHIIGYCTPLADHKSIKNLDKQKLNDQILRTTFDITELRNTMLDNLKDFGKKMVKEAMTEKRTVVVQDLPEGLKGLQRLAVVVPIFDSNNFMGFLTVFKDSFDRLYPGEKEVLEELAENLATVYALMAGKEVQRERNRLQGEMNTARTIQTSILPKKIQMPGFQVGTYMETATEVGGDVFDFIPSPFGTYFGIGDVAGHGLPAGMMAVISVAALHGAIDASKVLGKPLPLDQVYDTVNRVLCTLNRDRIGSDKFMTQNYFVANGGKIEHVGTHLPTAVWRAKTQTVEEITDLADKTGFLGLSEYVVSNQSLGSFTMNSGDVLVLYSDGVSESMNGNGTMFALEGIKRALVEHSDKAPDEFIAALLEDLRRHAAAGD